MQGTKTNMFNTDLGTKTNMFNTDKELIGATRRHDGGVILRALDLWSKDHEFNSWSRCYQAVSTWTGDCLRTGKPSRYTTNHQGQLSLPSLWGR